MRWLYGGMAVRYVVWAVLSRRVLPSLYAAWWLVFYGAMWFVSGVRIGGKNLRAAPLTLPKAAAAPAPRPPTDADIERDLDRRAAILAARRDQLDAELDRIRRRPRP